MKKVSRRDVSETITAAGHSDPLVTRLARKILLAWIEQNREFESEVDRACVWALVKQWEVNTLP